MARDREILVAAAALIHERGFGGVSVDQIGERAGVTGPAIYRHFKGKNDILVALFDEALDGLLDATAAEGDERGAARLRTLAAAHARYVLDASELANVWAKESNALPPEAQRRLRRRTARYFARWFEALAEAHPGLPKQRAQVAVHLAIAQLNVLWQYPVRGVADVADVAVEMALAGIEAAATAPAAVEAR